MTYGEQKTKSLIQNFVKAKMRKRINSFNFGHGAIKLKLRLDFCSIKVVLTTISHLDVVNDEVVDVESLVLSVALGILQKVEEELGRLLGPATLAGAVDLGL